MSLIVTGVVIVVVLVVAYFLYQASLPAFEVVKATWGNSDVSVVDVTTAVQALTDQNTGIITGPMHIKLSPDPAPNHVKTLTVTYNKSGKAAPVFAWTESSAGEVMAVQLP